jgi:4-amino-4-deoxy-L-arabinose transferase-like glycosyltransferase
VSDDDFARVVITQGFAHAPSLDPSGSSWLPLPFWLGGSVMMAFGRELFVARLTAVAIGIAASLLLFEAARWLVGDTRRAVAGTVLATVLPWSARLGVATVPELLAASCTVFAVASMAAGGTPIRRLAGAVALAAACLSRYEPWFVVAPFAVFTVGDAVREKRLPRADRTVLAFAAAAAVIAPLGWIAWNHHAHGDALAFVSRVASYKRALGEGTAGVAQTAKGTLVSLLSAEPEMWLAALFLLVGARLTIGAGLGVPRTWRRPLLVFAVAVLCLVLAGARDGAPTHHPERALLAPILLVAILVGAAGRRAFARIDAMPAGLAFGVATIAIVAAGWFARNWYWPVGALAHREQHAAVGAEAAAFTRPGEKVLVEVTDYGYFAVLAGSGRPEDFIADRSLDPRVTIARSAFDDEAHLDARIREIDARALVGRRTVLGARCPTGAGEMCWTPVPR